MLYIFVSVILNCCICSKSDFIDRLDLFFVNSYLIIKCNEREIQIIRSFNTYEEFKSNFECTNKNDLLEHENDKVQLVTCGQSTITCVKKKYLQMTGHFTRVKSSVKKDKKGVDWPIIHTKYTKEIKKSDPIIMNFIKKDQIDIIFDEIQVNQLKNGKNNLTIYFGFINRPMVCSHFFQGIEVKEKVGTCNPFNFDSVKSSMCYYKVIIIHRFKEKDFF